MVRAWNIRTGEWQSIPAHWIGHPIWGADFTTSKPEDAPAPAADTTEKPARRAEKKEGQ